MRFRLIPAATACFAVAAMTQTASAEIKVAVTIKPLHSLAAKVMAGVSEPSLILPDGASPHAYALRPSDMRKLSDADLIVRVDPEFETFLAKATKSAKKGRTIFDAMHAKGMELLEIRESGLWEGHNHDHGDEEGHEDDKHDHEKDHADGAKEKHDHDKHDHEHEKEHAHKAKDKHDHDKHDHDDDKEHAHKAEHGEHDDHGETDMHVWLKPENAIAIVKSLANTLASIDAKNAKTYQANAAKAVAEMSSLSATLEKKLHPVEGKKYFVFHDAYQYFETSFGMQAVGSISLNADRQPGARRIQELRERIKGAGDITCVFAEPQFNPRTVKALVHGTNVRAGVLDPIGVGIAAGPDAYDKILMRLADQLRDCLAPR